MKNGKGGKSDKSERSDEEKKDAQKKHRKDKNETVRPVVSRIRGREEMIRDSLFPVCPLSVFEVTPYLSSRSSPSCYSDTAPSPSFIVDDEGRETAGAGAGRKGGRQGGMQGGRREGGSEEDVSAAAESVRSLTITSPSSSSPSNTSSSSYSSSFSSSSSSTFLSSSSSTSFSSSSSIKTDCGGYCEKGATAGKSDVQILAAIPLVDQS